VRAGLACALILLSIGCSKVGTSTGQLGGNNSTVHGIVRLAILAEPNTLNPVLSGLIQEGDVEGAIFNGLVKLDDHEQLVPDLAMVVPSLANGGISRDGKTITYHLHHGVTWQDGAPLTSADVAFTYRTYINPKVNSFYTATYKRIASLQTPDPYTVVVHMKVPFAAALMNFFERSTGGFVIPKHILDKSPDINTDAFGKHPIGTGAFKLDSWEHGSLIVLKANPNYFGGAPRLREIDIHIVANPNTQLEMVGSHELDVASQLTPVQYGQIKTIKGTRAVLVPTLLERFITFNTKREPFDDARVRRALALALDRDRISMTAYSGTAAMAQTLIPPSNWAYDPTGAPAYDQALAKSLLDQAGWVVSSDGIRVKNGRTLSFGLLNQTEQNTLSTMAQEIQRAWRDIGVAADIRQVARNVIYGNPGLATDGKFDALVDDWGADPDPDRALIIETKSFSPHGYNDAFYSNSDIDRWSEQALATYDIPARKRLYSLIQRQLNQDLPYVPLVWDGRIYAVNIDLRGFSPEPVWTDFWNAETWQI
jgi:peptide/nickel transport system substrate-binding protein